MPFVVNDGDACKSPNPKLAFRSPIRHSILDPDKSDSSPSRPCKTKYWQRLPGFGLQAVSLRAHILILLLENSAF